MNHQIAEEAVEGIMQHAMKHTGNLLNEFKVREIINAAIEEATQELRNNIRLLHEKNQALVSENVALSRAAQENLSVTREGGISEATRENAVNAACFPATTENKTTEVQALPRSRSRAAQPSGEQALVEALKKILSDGQSREAQIARDALAMVSVE